MGYVEAHDEKLFDDPEVVSLRKKIKAVSSDELAIARPERQSKIRIKFSNNKELFYHAKSVRGTPDNPMDEKDIVSKSKRLLEVFKTSQTDDLINLILHKDFTVDELIKLCNLNLKE